VVAVFPPATEFYAVAFGAADERGVLVVLDDRPRRPFRDNPALSPFCESRQIIDMRPEDFGFGAFLGWNLSMINTIANAATRPVSSKAPRVAAVDVLALLVAF
jgi:hypothetical protein